MIYLFGILTIISLVCGCKEKSTETSAVSASGTTVPQMSSETVPSPDATDVPDFSPLCQCPLEQCPTKSTLLGDTSKMVCNAGNALKNLTEECDLAAVKICTTSKIPCDRSKMASLCYQVAWTSMRVPSQYLRDKNLSDDKFENISNCVRHVYWQAMLTCAIGKRAAEIIGDGHEYKTCTSSGYNGADSARDQCNNQFARNNSPDGDVMPKLSPEDCNSSARRLANQAFTEKHCATVTSADGCKYTVNFPPACNSGHPKIFE